MSVTAPDTQNPSVETVTEEGWVRVADPLEFTRPADEIERADAALAALAAQKPSTGAATTVFIYTTDIAAGEGAKTVLPARGTAIP